MPATRSHYEEVLADLIRRRDQLNIAIETLRLSMPPGESHKAATPAQVTPLTDATSVADPGHLEIFEVDPNEYRENEAQEAEEKDGRSRKEKKRQVAEALSNPALREKTDVEISRLCRVSRPFVAKIRKETGEQNASAG